MATADTAGSYDRMAAAYAERFLGELEGKPLDRMLLDHLVGSVRGPVADIGCGPGHVARYLAERGVTTFGFDLSQRMIEVAAAAHGRIGFGVADMRRLPFERDVWAGIVAFYSIIHLTVAELPAAFAEFHRVLRPGGTVLLSYHVGDKTMHVDEMLGRRVALDFHFLGREPVEHALRSAGLCVDAYLERRAYSAEVATTRAYVLATKPGTGRVDDRG